jgi:hypothetical protein
MVMELVVRGMQIIVVMLSSPEVAETQSTVVVSLGYGLEVEM